MIYTVDRIEGAFAVLLDSEGKSWGAPKSALPQIAEGDVIEKTPEGITLRPDLTRSRRSALAKRTRNLFKA